MQKDRNQKKDIETMLCVFRQLQSVILNPDALPCTHADCVPSSFYNVKDENNSWISVTRKGNNERIKSAYTIDKRLVNHIKPYYALETNDSEDDEKEVGNLTQASHEKKKYNKKKKQLKYNVETMPLGKINALIESFGITTSKKISASQCESADKVKK